MREGIGRGEGTTSQREFKCRVRGADESDAARTLLTWWTGLDREGTAWTLLVCLG